VLVLQAGDPSRSLVHREAARAARGALLRAQEFASLGIRSRVARKGVLVGAERLRFVRISFGAFLGKRGEGKIAYLVRCHIKVNLGGTRWARLVPAVLVNCLAREDKVRELLDARVEIAHRLALVKLLRSPVSWASGGDIENLPRVRRGGGSSLVPPLPSLSL
jgi:hypothetical protein